MIRAETIIAVNDVRRSSDWYTQLLGCKSDHGGDTFEVLVDEDGTVILCLHATGEHDHPTMPDNGAERGNGLILYLRVDDLGTVWRKALELNAVIESEPAVNPNSGKMAFALRDPDNYYLLISL